MFVWLSSVLEVWALLWGDVLLAATEPVSYIDHLWAFVIKMGTWFRKGTATALILLNGLQQKLILQDDDPTIYS